MTKTEANPYVGFSSALVDAILHTYNILTLEIRASDEDGNHVFDIPITMGRDCMPSSYNMKISAVLDVPGHDRVLTDARIRASQRWGTIEREVNNPFSDARRVSKARVDVRDRLSVDVNRVYGEVREFLFQILSPRLIRSVMDRLASVLSTGPTIVVQGPIHGNPRN